MNESKNPLENCVYHISIDGVFIEDTRDMDVVYNLIKWVENYGGVYKFGETATKGGAYIDVEFYMATDVEGGEE